MIEKLRLRNFQNHDKLDLDLGMVTSIVGGSDRGKSAITRALSWVITNRPKGAEFIRFGTDKAMVGILIDGKTITRLRGKSENSYKIGKKIYKAFGTEPPDEVIDLANLSDINFQGQHDAPYWFTLSAGEIAKKLNSVVDLSLIDEALSRLNQFIREAKADYKSAQAILERVEEKVEELTWVRGCREVFDKVKDQQKELDDLTRDHDNLESLLSDFESLGEMREVPDPTQLIEYHETHQELLALHSSLTTLISSLEEIEEDETDAINELRDLEQDLANQSEDVCPECGQQLP